MLLTHLVMAEIVCRVALVNFPLVLVYYPSGYRSPCMGDHEGVLVVPKELENSRSVREKVENALFVSDDVHPCLTSHCVALEPRVGCHKRVEVTVLRVVLAFSDKKYLPVFGISS